MLAIAVSGRTTRRLSLEREVTLTAADMAQPFDIDLSLQPGDRKALAGLARYYRLGLGTAGEEIARAAALGVPVAVLRFVGTSKNPYAALDQQATALDSLRALVGRDVISFVIDPFSLALNDNWSWGIVDCDGEVRLPETVHLLSAIAQTFGQAGAHGLFTLGRIDAEVEVTRAELDKINPSIKIYSFSQNSETSSAYIYLNTPVVLDTGQKILSGNCDEMTLRALIDIWDGTDVCIVKPMESYHLTNELAGLLTSESKRAQFLSADRVARLAGLSSDIGRKVSTMRANTALMNKKCEGVLVGGYAVSGTSYVLSLLESARGSVMARARLEEMWLNAAAAAGERRGPIVDRNVVAFLAGTRLC